MLQYAQDATETDTPWERWEWRDKIDAEFLTCQQHPSWKLNHDYRRKPQVIRVGRHEFPKPITEAPGVTTEYWVVRAYADKGYAPDAYTWDGDDTDYGFLEHGMVHLTKAAAQAHADVLNAIYRGDVE